MIKTFRGKLLQDGQDKIRLATKKGKIGYRIVKFQVMPEVMGGASSESCVKVFKVLQTTVTASVDFSDGNLLAAATITNHTSGYIYPPGDNIIFDQEIFNQDIYVTNKDNAGSEGCNYYLELETINMTDNAAAVSTLRDIRLNPQVGA